MARHDADGFDYDTNGNLHQAIESYWEGTDWAPGYRFTCTWGQSTSNDDNVIPANIGLHIRIAPNPFHSQISIQTQSKIGKPVDIIIYNTRGQLVRIMKTSNENTVNWDGKDDNHNSVANGVYLIKAKSSGLNATTKILKLK